MTMVTFSLAATLLTAAFPIDDLPRRGTLGLSLSPVPAAQRQQLSLPAGQGLVAGAPLPGLTADRAGIRAGDVIVTMNGKPVVQGAVSETVRSLPSGQTVRFELVRDGKKIQVEAALTEKPRDPGNANYEVVYSHVVSNGQRMRTIVSKPRKPGRYPALLFIQGFSPISYDYVLEGGTSDLTRINAPILFDFANDGFVTMRVEKPGVGDSEGGPFADLDYTTELDIYRQGLKKLVADASVDAKNVFIFGHSMGGAFGPMIACEIPVKGIAVYGTAARTWYEYLLDTVRTQGLLGGDTFEAADENVRQASRLMALVFHEGKSVAEVKQSHPELAALADGMMPGGLFNGKTTKFWAQLGQTNFPYYWARCNARVLSVRGASDFVTYDSDHKLIADVVNSKNPGWGTFEVTPASDHLLNSWPTEAESLRNWPQGTFNPAFGKRMLAWMKELAARE